MEIKFMRLDSKTSTTLSVRCDKKVCDQFKKITKKNGHTITEVINSFILEYLKGNFENK